VDLRERIDAVGFAGYVVGAVSERTENNLKVLSTWNLKAKARFWLLLSYVCHIRTTAACYRRKLLMVKFRGALSALGLSGHFGAEG